MTMSAEKLEPSADGEYYASDAQVVQGVPGARQGHLCCGCCCDTRRATIIVNGINLVFSGMALVGLGVISSDGFANSFDDDTVQADLSAATQYGWISMLMVGLAMAIACLGIFGALKYKSWMVMTAFVWYCASATLSLLRGDLGGAIISGFFAYPHIVFFQEMKKGVMTEELYPNEKHSCCCV